MIKCLLVNQLKTSLFLHKLNQTPWVKLQFSSRLFLVKNIDFAYVLLLDNVIVKGSKNQAAKSLLQLDGWLIFNQLIIDTSDELRLLLHELNATLISLLSVLDFASLVAILLSNKIVKLDLYGQCYDWVSELFIFQLVIRVFRNALHKQVIKFITQSILFEFLLKYQWSLELFRWYYAIPNLKQSLKSSHFQLIPIMYWILNGLHQLTKAFSILYPCHNHNQDVS